MEGDEMLHGRSAHEQHRTWQGFPRVITRAGGTHRVGLAPLPLLWRDADAQVGWYTRHPWTLAGRQVVRVQRHWCERCRRTYSEQSPWLVRGSWYAREVHRCALDHWLHLGTSVRRTAEVLRSWLGKQERWRLWRPLEPSPAPDDATACHLSGSTVQRWLDRAGEHARQTIPDQLAGVPTSGQLGTDGLWARLRQDTTRVVLLLTDSMTGVIWPPVVALG